MAKTPEQSDHTSIQQRIKKAINTQQPGRRNQQPEALLPFVGNPRKDMPQGLPFQLNDYLVLVDWSGRILRENKKGVIPKHLHGILQRLAMDAKQFIYLTQNFEHPFKNLVGATHHVRKACESIGQNWVYGMSQCEAFFSSS